ncbi:metallophosphoesterase family protein [Paenibacillus rigui]|uniref:Phosphohydrolase n=1 Tax=Paenibacillus rigui TaxID=554312 RepID=A0A229UTE1_9BACL|nr:metallophosphoesterase [Paenibacillus rigui]OXM86786.1 phosphohydrolase [Paenibacillus rigui]
MMSRRHFIKKMLYSLGLLTLGTAASIPLVRRWNVEAEPEKPESNNVEIAEPGIQDEASLPKPPLLTLFLLSDLHISVGESSMTDKLHLALKDLSEWETQLDTIILGGDLTDFGRESDYKLLQSILDQYQLPPLYANMGNHDYYDIWLNGKGAFSTETMPNGKTDAMSRERFMKFIGYSDQPYTDVWLNGVHLIMVSQESYAEEKPEVGEGAWYSDEQLAWLRETMKAHEDGKPAFVFIHQPLPEPGSDGRTHQLIRANAFREILAPYRNVFVLSGHTHRNFVGENHYNQQNTFHWFNNASVGRTRSILPGQTNSAAQGLFIQVFPHEVVLRGREFSNRTWIDSAQWAIPVT